MRYDPPEEMPVRCPCCGNIFMFPSGHKIHDKEQLEIFEDPFEVHHEIVEAQREIHPEVNDDD